MGAQFHSELPRPYASQDSWDPDALVWRGRDPRRPILGLSTAPLLEKHRLTVEHTTAHAIVSAASLDEAAPRVLEAMCESLGWEHGAYWTVERAADVLRCANIWTLAGSDVPSSIAPAAR